MAIVHFVNYKRGTQSRAAMHGVMLYELYEWFRTEAESDSLEDAIDALAGDYEEMEIRLVRMKFLSEVAN